MRRRLVRWFRRVSSDNLGKDGLSNRHPAASDSSGAAVFERGVREAQDVLAQGRLAAALWFAEDDDGEADGATMSSFPVRRKWNS